MKAECTTINTIFIQQRVFMFVTSNEKHSHITQSFIINQILLIMLILEVLQLIFLLCKLVTTALNGILICKNPLIDES